jgi:hypothetical protein
MAELTINDMCRFKWDQDCVCYLTAKHAGPHLCRGDGETHAYEAKPPADASPSEPQEKNDPLLCIHGVFGRDGVGCEICNSEADSAAPTAAGSEEPKRPYFVSGQVEWLTPVASQVPALDSIATIQVDPRFYKWVTSEYPLTCKLAEARSGDESQQIIRMKAAWNAAIEGRVRELEAAAKELEFVLNDWKRRYEDLEAKK